MLFLVSLVDYDYSKKNCNRLRLTITPCLFLSTTKKQIKPVSGWGKTWIANTVLYIYTFCAYLYKVRAFSSVILKLWYAYH